MDFDQLKYFQVLAETGNFTEAAQRMNLSQPAFSRSIQRLEEDFGQPLFDRKPRSVELTDAGKRCLQASNRILQIMDDTRAEITDDGQTGKLHIGSIPTIAPYFLPNLLRRFANEYPQAQLIVHEYTTQELLKRCKRGEIDLAIAAAPITEKYVDVDELFSEELLLVLPEGHPLGEAAEVKMNDIEGLPMVMLDEVHCLSDNITSFCQHRRVQPVVVERANQLATVQELVALAHGVSMIPEMAMKLDRNESRIYRSLCEPKPTRQLVAITNPYRFQSRLLKSFRNVLIDYCGR